MTKINNQIWAKEVRLVDLPEKYQNGVYSIEEAKKIAEDLGEDLILISENANPPVCKIMEFSKYLYVQKQKEKLMKKNSKANELKEIKLEPNISDHDLQTKANKVEEFLTKGSKVKLTLEFKGRMIQFKEKGQLALYKLISLVEKHGVPENVPKLEGKRMITTLKPKK